MSWLLAPCDPLSRGGLSSGYELCQTRRPLRSESAGQSHQQVAVAGTFAKCPGAPCPGYPYRADGIQQDLPVLDPIT